MVKIWQANNRLEWTERSFDVIGQISFTMKQADKAIEKAQAAVDIYNGLGDPGAAAGWGWDAS